jgi:hypothetical protein
MTNETVAMIMMSGMIFLVIYLMRNISSERKIKKS